MSVYSRKMDYYLQLRGLPYTRCVQPPNLPRPDLEKLGIKYRRIPLLAIGRDIYCDTRIIIDKLEHMFPDGALGSRQPFEQGLEKVLESWVIDAGPFWRTAGCIPLSAPLLKDPAWIKDRSEGSGGKFSEQMLTQGRPESLAHLRMYYGIAESLLADGREWIFKTERPSLGDVHAIWSFDWGINLTLSAGQENVGEATINERDFPKVFAWVRRFRNVYKQVVKQNGEARLLSSEETIQKILGSDYWEDEGHVDANDPLQLRKGQVVSVTPIDFGFTHSDKGELLSMTVNEVVISSKIPGGSGALRLHYPRSNFRILALDGQSSRL